MKYRREIDGLRALAVMPVILFHAGIGAFSGGFVGVDVFFVISGYLITAIILSDLEKENFSITKFYERRARRILPALFLVMIACIPFAGFLLLPSEMKAFSQSLVAVPLFASNFLFWSESGYFDTAAELKPLLHTWSLAVEEQYYVLFPIFLMVFWNLGRRWILTALSFLFVISILLAEWAVYAKPAAAFYLLPTRGWELLVGAFLAFYLSQDNRVHFSKVIGELGGWFGIALILFSIFSFSKTTPFPGFNALVPTLGTALIILFTTQQTSAGKFLGNKAFVGIGLISYSAYLWHQPLFAFARIYTFDNISFILTIFIIILTFVLSYLSYKYVETPFRNSEKFTRSKVFSISMLTATLLISIGLIGHLNNGFPGKQAVINKAIGDWEYPGELTRTNIDGFYKFNVTKPVDILFFGDSHAEQLVPLSSEIAASGLNVGFFTGGGCPPIPNLLDDLHRHCFDIFERLNNILNSEKNIRTIIVSGCFNCYFVQQSPMVSNPEGDYNYYYMKEQKKYFSEMEKVKPKLLLALTIFSIILQKNIK